LSVVGLGLVLSVRAARAESQAEIANRENEEGKELMFGGKYAEASAKFRDAVARVPEAKYFFNLCTSLYQEGKFGEALTACDHALQNNPDEKLKGKVDKLVTLTKDQAKMQGVDLQPTGGGGLPDPNQPQPDPNQPQPDPNQPQPDPNQPQHPPPPRRVAYAVGRPPTIDVVHAARPQHNYTWALGIDLYGGAGVIGGKDASGQDAYGAAAGGFRLKSDFLLNPVQRFGVQAYLQYTHFGASDSQVMMGASPTTLDVIDLGGALYKHFCVPGVERLCVTPLVGAHLALLSPDNAMDAFGSQVFNYAAVGGRAEVAATIGLGPRYEHVFSVGVGLNAYSAALSSPANAPASSVFLDSGGAFAYLSVGYTYRFNTPLGGRPIIILE
jgi:hypothetical protein